MIILYKNRYSPGESRFLDTIRIGDINGAMYFINQGTDINTRDAFGNTPLMIAAINGYLIMVDRLLIEGADTTLRNNDGYSALMLASQKNLTDIIFTLLEHGVSRKDYEDVQQKTNYRHFNLSNVSNYSNSRDGLLESL